MIIHIFFIFFYQFVKKVLLMRETFNC